MDFMSKPIEASLQEQQLSNCQTTPRQNHFAQVWDNKYNHSCSRLCRNRVHSTQCHLILSRKTSKQTQNGGGKQRWFGQWTRTHLLRRDLYVKLLIDIELPRASRLLDLYPWPHKPSWIQGTQLGTSVAVSQKRTWPSSELRHCKVKTYVSLLRSLIQHHIKVVQFSSQTT